MGIALWSSLTILINECALDFLYRELRRYQRNH